MNFLEKEVANAPVQHIDDTKNIILDIVKGIEVAQEEALQKGKDPKTVRSGIHTTNFSYSLQNYFRERTKKKGMSKKERLLFHQKHSQPLMLEMKSRDDKTQIGAAVADILLHFVYCKI